MKLILAQGNPESRYAATRHNVGFILADTLARTHGASWVEKTKFHAHIAELSIHGEKVLLAKPTTYYNETGRSARAIVDFYKLDPMSDVLVIHDDLALPLGSLRVRSSGSDAGNNGVKSLNSHIGQQYKRLRVGIWNKIRDQQHDVDFVLGAISKHEEATLKEQLPSIASIAEDFAKGTLSDTTLALEEKESPAK